MKKDYMKIVGISYLLIFSINTLSLDSRVKKDIPLSMGINLNEPQSQVDIVATSQIFGDLAKSFRPFKESVIKRIRKSLQDSGVDSVIFNSEDDNLNSKFIDYDSEAELDKDLYRLTRSDSADEIQKKLFKVPEVDKLSSFQVRSLTNRFAQVRYSKFSEYGVVINGDGTAKLRSGSYVYTTGLESAEYGDIPNGVYPLFFDGDVDVKVEGVGKFTKCPKKYKKARKCIDIKITKTPIKKGLKLTFTAKSNTHLKNFHLVMPTVNLDDVLLNKIVFNPAYLEYIKPFSTYRVMNMLLASPKSPFECVSTYVANREPYLTPKTKLEREYLENLVNIKLLSHIKEKKLKKKELDLEKALQYFKDYKNKDDELFFTETELTIVEDILSNYLDSEDLFDKTLFDDKIKESQEKLPKIKEKLIVLRLKLSEYNWNYVNPNEDYGNCLMKYSRTNDSRAKLTDQFWGNSFITPEETWTGVPYEVVVALANKTNANLWLNIPHNATKDYVEGMAKYFKDNLNEKSKVFVELSNEIWNGGFASQKYFSGISKYRYEYFVTAALNQFEHYLKTSKDKTVANKKFRKRNLKYFNKYKKEILSEILLFKKCKIDSDSLECNKFEEPVIVDMENLKEVKYKKKNFFEGLRYQIPTLSAYWLGYTDAAKPKLKVETEIGGEVKYNYVNRYKYTKSHKSELHSPDLIYHYSGDEIRDLQKNLFAEYKKGWKKRRKNTKIFDLEMNAKIYVLKNLNRYYINMAQMAYVDRFNKVIDSWKKAGFDNKQMISVLGTKQNNPNLTKVMLDYAKHIESLNKIDTIGTAAYFFGCFGDLKVDDKTIKPHKFGPCKGIAKGVLNAKTPEDIIDILKDPANPKGVNAVKEQMRLQFKVIKEIDKKIKLVAYEGGHHLTLTNLGRNQSKYIHSHRELKNEKLELFKKAILLDGMGELTKELYKVWEEEGGLVFNNFYMPQSFHEWGSLGLSYSISDMDTPRYLAAKEYSEVYEKIEVKKNN